MTGSNSRLIRWVDTMTRFTICAPHEIDFLKGEAMKLEFSGIERRLQRLDECLNKLKNLKSLSKENLFANGYARDSLERNLEVAIQCVIDIANRILSLSVYLQTPSVNG